MSEEGAKKKRNRSKKGTKQKQNRKGKKPKWKIPHCLTVYTAGWETEE